MATKKTTKKVAATKAVKKASENVSAPIYATSGKSTSNVELSGLVFDRAWNGDLVHHVVTGMMANTRTGLAHTKDRSEVSGGGKKPWQQKGTGRARHGSSRSPIWRKGGTTHGPRSEKDYTVKLNKKEKTAALFATLTRKFKTGKIIFSEMISFDNAKTKDAQMVLKNFESISGFETINTNKKNNILIVSPTISESMRNSFRNITHVTLMEGRNLNPVDVMKYRYMIISNPAEVQAFFLTKKGAVKKAA
jgi:large subunit ribosomal protein L4